MTRVVNIHKEPCTVYIGRKRFGMHYGNIAAMKEGTLATLQFGTRREALMAFHAWLAGTAHLDIEPERREWILANLEGLRGESLGCTCKPQACHGDVYRVLLGEISLEEAIPPVDKPEQQMSLF